LGLERGFVGTSVRINKRHIHPEGDVSRSVPFVPVRHRALEWQLRLDMAAQAKRFLYVSTYYVENDIYGHLFLDALAAAAQRGVYVFLGLDTFGQYLGNYARPRKERNALDARLQAIKRAGVQVALYRAQTPLQRVLGAGHHVKIQVSDAGQVLIGSSNISSRSFKGWGEFSAVLEGSIAARSLHDLQRLFRLDQSLHRQHAAALATARDVEWRDGFEYIFHDPNASAHPLHPIVAARNPISARLVKAIDTAAQQVLISSFYIKPTDVLAKSILNAARRGVRVELFHSHRQCLAESKLPWLSAALEYPRFLDAGVRIFESRRGEHAKLFAIDDAWAAFGSYNAEHAAHDRLAEILIGSDRTDVVAAITRMLDTMRCDPEVVEIKDCSDLNRSVNALQRAFWRHFKRWI
jgi:cardiolipin synthase